MNIQDIKNQKKIHFIGLGGIGMSALALILREWKVPVQGSDLAENYLTPKLRDKGVTYFVGHKKENISDDVSLIVQTSIIKTENPEILEAEKKKIPIITRAKLLGIIMGEYQGITIAGTHGKTSTTGIVSLVLEKAGLDPTVINGGVIHYFGSNSKVGKGSHLVAESDESDASFVELPSFIGAVTNIEPEHLEFKGYGGDFEKQKAYFERYVRQIPDAGMCVLCIDSPEVKKIYEKLKSEKKNLVTYSLKDENADLIAKNVVMDSKGLTFDVKFKDGREIKNIKMPIFGKHNAGNALIAVAIADFLKVPLEKIIEGLAAFNGVKRRFTKVGEYNGVSIIDDYGHHSTEIATTLKAAREVAGKHKVICVFQPHKYTRLRDLFNEFCNAFSDADVVIVSEIYSAGQAPIEGISQDALVRGIEKTGHKNVIKLPSEKDLAKIIKSRIKPGDMVFCTGAGTITNWAAALAEQLKSV
jgi:UDP-N-acetylmuramate--alanine ligase